MQRAPITPLAQVLRAEGRKQSWLAATLGVAEVQVWRWVHGIHEPGASAKAAIATALGRTVEELFEAHDNDGAAQAAVPTDRIGDVAA